MTYWLGLYLYLLGELNRYTIYRMSILNFSFRQVTHESSDYIDYLGLRYDIFCCELQRVSGSSFYFDKQVETDQFDTFSKHILATHTPTGQSAACIRLIMPNPCGLNVNLRYKIDRSIYPDSNASNTGEISRMAISPLFRRQRLPNINPRFQNNKTIEGMRRKHYPELVFGVFREIYTVASKGGLEYCYAAMDDAYVRLLKWMGIPFVPVGPYNMAISPMRRPYIISIDVLRNSKACLDIVKNAG